MDRIRSFPDPALILRSAAILLTGLALAACGGGGSSGSAPAPVPPAATNVQINASNYLDAAAVGSVGRGRAIELASLLDFSFALAVQGNFGPGSVSCIGGGTLQLAVTSPSSNTMLADNCGLSAALLKSGTIRVSGLETVTSGAPPVTNLVRGDYAVQNFVTRFDPVDAIDQTYNASVQAARQPDTSITITGPFSVVRHSRADDYAALVINITKPGGRLTATGLSFEVSTPRFSIAPLRVTASEGTPRVLRVTAPDGSYVKVTSLATSGSLYEVFASATATTPAVAQTLSESDPLVTAALARALRALP